MAAFAVWCVSFSPTVDLRVVCFRCMVEIMPSSIVPLPTR